jgi:phosphoglycolate phosphatase
MYVEKLPVKGLIIDFEGTLADTSYFYYRLLKDSAQRTGIEFDYSFSEIQKIRDCIADGVELIKRIGKEYKEIYMKKIKEIYWDYNYKYVHLFPEAIDVLSDLVNLGFSISIYTNLNWSWTQIIDRFPEFKDVEASLFYLNRNNVENPKPSPEGVHICCREMGINPEDVAVVGDSLADTKMGKEAGCYTVGVLTGVSTEKRLNESRVNVIIPRIGYITDVLY